MLGLADTNQGDYGKIALKLKLIKIHPVTS
jgi:hypothetical protein